MKPVFQTAVICLFLAALSVLAGCGRDPNPIAPFQPEVVTTADAFQFQITDASNVSTNLSYNWNNSDPRVTVDHSTARRDGVAGVSILDADGVEVYSSSLLASGTQTSTTGNPGNWTINVSFVNFDGTVNFRVERLP